MAEGPTRTPPQGYEEFKKCLNEEVERFKTESTRHKALHRRCQTVIIALTAFTTIVAGAGLVLPKSAAPAAQFSVVCLTAASTAVAAWAAMRHTRELWEHERGIYYELLDLKRELSFQEACGTLKECDVQQFFARTAAALQTSARGWAQILKTQAAGREHVVPAAMTDAHSSVLPRAAPTETGK